MSPQFDHYLLTSFKLFVENQLLSKGNAFTNYSSRLYPVSSQFQGLYAYATPFRGLCNDVSVSGANILTGVYLNNTFVGIGTSGLTKINYDLGTVYFNSQLPSNMIVSGNYSIKDFNVAITDDYEYKLLYATKYVLNSKFNQTLSGLPSDVVIAPIIYLRPTYLENRPFAFGRIDDNTVDIRAIVIADNQYSKMGASDILRNFNMRVLPYITSTPLSFLGEYTGIPYNYSGLTQDTVYFPTIWSAKVIEPVAKTPEFEDLTRNIALVDFRISCVMTHP